MDAVSIRASAREATGRVTKSPTTSGCFNPRLRAGGDSNNKTSSRRLEVSIRASAREATGGKFPKVASAEFQSAPPRGRRRFRVFRVRQRSEVSIRASAREATTPAAATRRRRRCFNPRLRAGGDAGASSCTARPRSFNPRLRAGGDTHVYIINGIGYRFQSAALSNAT